MERRGRDSWAELLLLVLAGGHNGVESAALDWSMIMEVASRMLERVGGILSLWRFLGESKGGEEGKRYLGKHFLSSRPSFSANQKN